MSGSESMCTRLCAHAFEVPKKKAPSRGALDYFVVSVLRSSIGNVCIRFCAVANYLQYQVYCTQILKELLHEGGLYISRNLLLPTYAHRNNQLFDGNSDHGLQSPQLLSANLYMVLQHQEFNRCIAKIEPIRSIPLMFGPTTGDRLRLADTERIIEVEKDRSDLRRRGQVRRRKGDPRRDGAGADHSRGRRG